MEFQHVIYGSDDDGSHGAFAGARGEVGALEFVEAGLVVADGVSLDLRGGWEAASVRYDRPPLVSDGLAPSVELIRAADGMFKVVLTETPSNKVSSDTTATITANLYPHAYRGSTGQTVTATAPGSISPLAGLKARLRQYHGAIKVMTGRLAEQAAEHDEVLVSKGHAWGYWGGHVPAYMIGNNTALGVGGRRRWVEVSLGVLGGLNTDAAALGALYQGINPVAKPSGPVTLVNPATGAVLTFATAFAITPSAGGYPALPGPADLGDGAWIDRLGA